MANIKSSKKRVLIARKRAAANKAKRSALRTYIKKARNAATDNAPEAAEAVRVAIKKIDQAAAKGLIHKNTAARKKSKLAKALNASVSQ
ncbi:MAG TPA: 30S ribosomal protein S20 [Clostridiaceae bacterium]|nr:30S ribosomal protein S20 [Clostridiaceae bacterium]HOA30687.1 30S ribosomal protein S20 [Clostridia bacterium]